MNKEEYADLDKTHLWSSHVHANHSWTPGLHWNLTWPNPLPKVTNGVIWSPETSTKNKSSDKADARCFTFYNIVGLRLPAGKSSSLVFLKLMHLSGQGSRMGDLCSTLPCITSFLNWFRDRSISMKTPIFQSTIDAADANLRRPAVSISHWTIKQKITVSSESWRTSVPAPSSYLYSCKQQNNGAWPEPHPLEWSSLETLWPNLDSVREHIEPGSRRIYHY